MRGLSTEMDVRMGTLSAQSKKARRALDDEKWAGWPPEKLRVVRRLVDALEASESALNGYVKGEPNGG